MLYILCTLRGSGALRSSLRCLFDPLSPPLLIRSKSICWIPAMSSVTPTETAGGTANCIGLDDEIESAVNLPQLKGLLCGFRKPRRSSGRPSNAEQALSSLVSARLSNFDVIPIRPNRIKHSSDHQLEHYPQFRRCLYIRSLSVLDVKI